MTRLRLGIAGYENATGYGTAARRVRSALQSVGHETLWVPIEQGPVDNRPGWPIRDAELATQPSPIDETDVVILQLPPDHCVDVRRRLTTQGIVVSTVWETDRLPAEWENHYDVGGIVVPTDWNAELLRDRGLRNVHVIPHALHLAEPSAAPLPISITPDTFVFYVINTWSARKAMDETLAAYLRAFTAHDDVLFVIKTEVMTGDYIAPRSPTWKRVVDGVRQAQNPPPVMLVTDLWSDAEIAALHQRGDCFVSLTHGEGWGLGIFDAVLHENAVITTGWGAPAEYLPGHPGLIPFDLGTAAFTPGRTYGNWANARSAEAIDQMRAAYLDRGANLAAHSRRCAQMLRERCSLPAVGEAFVNVCAAAA